MLLLTSQAAASNRRSCLFFFVLLLTFEVFVYSLEGLSSFSEHLNEQAEKSFTTNIRAMGPSHWRRMCVRMVGSDPSHISLHV